jgi:ACS family D-galactonate transporter-like MFS transporter
VTIMLRALRQNKEPRWLIGLLLGSGILINFFDRSTLSIAGKPIADSFGLSLGELGVVLSAFTWSYCLMQVPSGFLVDRLGVTWPNRVGTVLWGFGCLLSALAVGPVSLLISRVVLGIGEAPGMVAAAKATSTWFPLTERSLATALFDGATKLSNVIALPILALVVSVWGWRSAFVCTAALSAGYTVAWWRGYRNPPQDRGVADKHRDAPRTATRQASGLGSLLVLVHDRRVWTIVVGFACYGYAINVLLTWIPSYLEIQLHMPVLESGLYTAIPWAVATAADIVIGGWMVDRAVRSARDPSRVRKMFLMAGFVLGLTVGLAAATQRPATALLWITLSIAGLSVAAPVAWSMPGLIVAQDRVGRVSGMMNFANTLATTLGLLLTGFLAQFTRSFVGPFLLAAAVLVVGMIMYGPCLGRLPSPVSPGGGDS